MDKKIYDTYVRILTEELVPALGCTEPIALAYASDTDKGTVTFELMTTSGAVLYTINRNGVATPGTKVEAEVIKGASLLKQK